MRNLELDVVNFRNVPEDCNNVKYYVEVENTIFLLNNNCVHYIKNDINVIIKKNIHSMVWIPVENILYMADGEQFECFNKQTEKSIVIEITNGFLIYEWNPSQDRIALIDKSGKLKIVLLDGYNAHFTVIGEYVLDTLENSPFINIGWGSKVTQFHGSEGKNAREVIISKDTDVPQSDNCMQIAWRDDGDIFAVNILQDGHRIFKIFSCECDFLYENEFKPGMGPQLAWKPDGSLLATDCESPNGNYIMFFEKNGLHRYDLKLRSNLTIKKIQWNGTGDILMIWQSDVNNVDKNSDEIQLWTCSNFHWYKKQSLFFTEGETVHYVGWYDKKWLEIVTTNTLLRYSWKRVVNVNSNCQTSINHDQQLETLMNNLCITKSKDLGAITVIDGCVLHVTISSLQIVPPPMDSYRIEFDRAINFVTFGSKPDVLVVVLDDYSIKILQLFDTSFSQTHSFSIPVDSDITPLMLNHFVYDDVQSALYWIESLLDGTSTVQRCSVSLVDNNFCLKTFYTAPQNITDLLPVETTSGIQLGIYEDGQIMICQPDLDNEAELITVEDINLCNTEDGGCIVLKYIHSQYNVFTLNQNSFYYNNEKVMNNVTSFTFCKSYLLLTTIENKLLCIRLSENSLARLKSHDLSQIYSRSIPTGALLVNTIPNTSKVVLQVPRGELEVINPRPLAIDEIDKLLSQKKHLEAFKMMRADRIDSNILYDMNPTRFINDIEDFVRNVNNCEYIDVILTQMLDGNIIQNLYKNCFEDIHSFQSSGMKLHSVLDAFIETMKKVDVNYFLQSIITAYLCKGSEIDLEHALEELIMAKQREDTGIKFRTSVDSTLEHMILLSSVEKIYSVALGMDKLELIMWVTSKSQLDPLEYIPFLHELGNMNDNYRKYTINSHIKRFEEALKYLVQCDGVLNELNGFISKNKLYKYIVRSVEPNNQWFQPLTQCYADYLHTEGQYKEAGLISMARNDFKSAVTNFIKASCMKETLAALNCANVTQVERNDILNELAERLLADQNYIDASQLYEIHLYNYEEAISVLLQAKFWTDAYYLALKHNRKDIIDSDIKIQVLSYTDNLSSTFSTLEEEFTKLTNRLQTIRTEKIAQFKSDTFQICDVDDELQGANHEPGRDFDLDSLVSTNCTTVTGHSSRSTSSATSSKRKKRLQQKKMQIREGTIFENIAIIRRLHIIITEFMNLARTVNDTCTILLLFPDSYNKGITVQTTYENLLNIITVSSDQIWPSEMILPPNPMTKESHVCRLNIEHLEMHYRYPPQDIKKNWKKLLSFSIE